MSEAVRELKALAEKYLEEARQLVSAGKYSEAFDVTEDVLQLLCTIELLKEREGGETR